MNSKNYATYNPQNLKSIEPKARTGRKTTSATARTIHEGKGFQTNTGFPRSILEFSSESKGFHPTQKPVDLFEYLIRTYTNEGETVLDNTAGSGTTAIAAERSGRKWICIERDEAYSDKALERIRLSL